MLPIPVMLSRRLRETPFEKRMLEHAPAAFTIYNRMTLPTVFRSLESDYAHLCEHVQVWDVAVERQVELTGTDALRLAELVTPRDLSDMRIGQGRYAPLVDEKGGIVNDPLILKLAEDRYWFSIADSDVLLWLKGLAVGMQLDVEVFEPDVSPLAIQGPKSEEVLVELVGEHIRDIAFFSFIETEIVGVPVLVARSGWSGQGGFEIYLQGHQHGPALWDAVFEAGRKYQIRAGCPNQIERLETGLLSYGNDMTLANTPFECGLDRFFTLGKSADYISRFALDQLVAQGKPQQKLSRVLLAHNAPLMLRSWWSIKSDGKSVGYVTSQAHSSKYQGILAFAYVDVEVLESSAPVEVVTEDGLRIDGIVCQQGWPKI